ncbi:MAG: phage portal protein [Streptomyces sp.]|nr:phage portal protein [Streptomyces sp.]
MTKAAAPAPAATFSADQVAALVTATAPQTTGAFNPLPRTDPPVAFGPGTALIPTAIDPVRRDTGRSEPRFNEYLVSSNLPGVTDRIVPWKVLRDAADAGGMPRRCIETRKAEVATLDWVIAPTKTAVAQAQAADPAASRADVEAHLRERLGPEIARCSKFWEEPDRGQDEDFVEWTSKILEDHFVLDAVAVYPKTTYGGDLYALEVVDPSTIKVLRDHRGGKPAPPQPAYQQLLWGFPRGEFIADVDGDGNVINGYTPDTLIYKRRNVRSWTVYGHSAVEQCLEDLDVWLRRRTWIRAEYSDGTIPSGLLKNTGASAWTPAQVLEYERALNDAWSGQILERHRMRILPPGFELETQADAAEKYKPEYDLFLLKQLASHFDTTIAELGFTEAKGLGSGGFHEGQADVQERKGTLPTMRWLQALFTSISRRQLRMPAELEFRFLGLEDEDEAAADSVSDVRVRSGRMTLNEDRDRLGLPRYDFAEADMPMVIGQRGVVFLEGASQLAPPGAMVEPAQAGKSAPETASQADPGSADDEPTQESNNDSNPDAVKAELAAFLKWDARHRAPHHRFEFQSAKPGDAPWLDGDPRAVFKAADAGPKALPSAKTWPGWERDEETAAIWARRLRRTMTRAVDARRLAEAWLVHSLVKDDEPDLTGLSSEPLQPDTFGIDAGSWLAGQNVDLIAALAMIAEIQAEGYAIGNLSSLAVLSGSAAVDWSAWTPGDAEAARLVLDENGRNGLVLLLDRAGVNISSIAANRMDALAKALSDALARGDSADTLARALRGILDDPKWAEMVAVTELARATSAASLDTYQANGVAQVDWLIAPSACPMCQENADASPIPTGAAFPSGDVMPPGHPRCRCSLSPA